MSGACDVALVTYAALPELDPDDRPLAAALRERGLRVAVIRWDDPAFDWGAARSVVLRNPWDYFHRRDEFLAWAERVAAAAPLWNPLPVVRWNLHKRYLLELESRGAPIVPTLELARETRANLSELMAERDWSCCVVKPAVSADSWETEVFDLAQVERGQAHLERMLAGHDMLVQPFLTSVEQSGERCLVFLDGEFSHAVRKNALTRGGRWAGVPEGAPVEASAAELDAARRVLAATPFRELLYARVDLVRDADDRPLLLELELVEPTLFLADAPRGRERLVAAIERRL